MTAKDKGGKHMEQMKNRKEHEAADKHAGVRGIHRVQEGVQRLTYVLWITQMCNIMTERICY